MSRIEFQWDLKKNALNEKKHGVTFEEAKTVFTDQYARIISDPDHSETEDRFILLGTSIHSRLLVVCHCVRENESIRIISARKANKDERFIYEEFSYA